MQFPDPSSFACVFAIVVLVLFLSTNFSQSILLVLFNTKLMQKKAKGNPASSILYSKEEATMMLPFKTTSTNQRSSPFNNDPDLKPPSNNNADETNSNASTSAETVSTYAASAVCSMTNYVSEYLIGGGSGSGGDTSSDGLPQDLEQQSTSVIDSSQAESSFGYLSSLFSNGSQRSITGNVTGTNPSSSSTTTTTRTTAMELVPMSFTLEEGRMFEYYNELEHDVIGNAFVAYTMNNQYLKIQQNLDRLASTGTCVDERLFYIKTITKTISKSWPIHLDSDIILSPLLDSWKEVEPNNVDCRILYAQTYLEWAWHARRYHLKHIGVFISRLQMCAEELHELQILKPNDPLIYEIGIQLAKAMGRWNEKDDGSSSSSSRSSSIMTVEDCLSKLEQNVPCEEENSLFCYSAHIAAFQYYNEQRYNGRSSHSDHHEQVWTFVRQVSKNLPVGHPLWVLIPMAHFECAGGGGGGTFSSNQQYWKQPDVVEETMTAYSKVFPPSNSTNDSRSSSPHQQRKRSRPYAQRMEWECRNYFAYTLTKCGQKDLARSEIRIIGKRPIQGLPWGDINGYKQVIRDELGFEF